MSAGKAWQPGVIVPPGKEHLPDKNPSETGRV